MVENNNLMVRNPRDTTGEYGPNISRRTILSGLKGAAFGSLVLSGVGTAAADSSYYKTYGNTDTTSLHLNYEAQHASTIQVFNPHQDSTGSSDYWEFTVQIGTECGYYDPKYDIYTSGIQSGLVSMDWSDDPNLEPVTIYKDKSHIGAWEDGQNPSDDYDAADFFYDTAINTGELLCAIAQCSKLVDAASWVYNEIGYLSSWLESQDPTYLELQFNRDNRAQVSNNVAFDVNLFPGESMSMDILSQHSTDTGQPFSSYNMTITAPSCSPSNGYPCSSTSLFTTTQSSDPYRTVSGREVQKNPTKFGMLPNETKDLKGRKQYVFPDPQVNVTQIPLSENSAYQQSSAE